MTVSFARDANRVTVIGGTSSADGITPVVPYVDPITHRLLVDATGATVNIYTETPSGTINGSNKAFTTAHSISTIIGLYMNGAFIHPVDYSVAGSTITFGTAPDVSFSGLPFTVVYV